MIFHLLFFQGPALLPSAPDVSIKYNRHIPSSVVLEVTPPKNLKEIVAYEVEVATKEQYGSKFTYTFPHPILQARGKRIMHGHNFVVESCGWMVHKVLRPISNLKLDYVISSGYLIGA